LKNKSMVAKVSHFLFQQKGVERGPYTLSQLESMWRSGVNLWLSDN